MITVNKGCLQKLKAQTVQKIPDKARAHMGCPDKQKSWLEKEEAKINRRFLPSKQVDRDY